MKIIDLPVEQREKLGSAHSRRFRRAGQIPAILYGGGQDNVALALDGDAFQTVLKAHTAIVRLKLGERGQTALVREITWDTFGEYVEHVDLFRVEMEDEVKLSIPVEVRGIPAGVSQGGQIQQVIKDLDVFTRVDSIPSQFVLDISELQIGDGIHVNEVEFPENVRSAVPEGVVIVQVRAPKVVEEPEEEDEAEGIEGEAAAPASDDAPAEAPAES